MLGQLFLPLFFLHRYSDSIQSFSQVMILYHALSNPLEVHGHSFVSVSWAGESRAARYQSSWLKEEAKVKITAKPFTIYCDGRLQGRYQTQERVKSSLFPFPPRLATLVEGRVDRRRYGGHLCLPIAAGDMNQRVLPFYEPEARGRAESRAWSGKVLRTESEWKSAPKDPCLLQLLGLGRDSEENILERLPQREFRTEVPGPRMQKSLGRRAPWGPDRSSIPRRQLHPEKALKRFCWEAWAVHHEACRAKPCPHICWDLENHIAFLAGRWTFQPPYWYLLHMLYLDLYHNHLSCCVRIHAASTTYP